MSEKRPLRPEPLWYLRGLGYSDYLHSDHWKLRRQEFLAGRELRCERCGLEFIDEAAVAYVASVFSPEPAPEVERRRARFNVHHRSYERLGCERDEDLELLCLPCHNREHHIESHAARWWHAYLNRGAGAA